MVVLDLSPQQWVSGFCITIIALSFSWTCFLGIRSFLGFQISERIYWRLIWILSLVLFHLALLAFLIYKFYGLSPIHISLPEWFAIGDYHFETSLLIDDLSLIYLLLTSTISGIIFKFSLSYLHREPGFERFLGATFAMISGLFAISLGGSFDEILIGWEIVGVASVLLISFFKTNTRSVANSLRALTYYRFCDMSLISASALMHYVFHTNEFAHLHTASSEVTPYIGALIILGTLAKSAQLPMTPWLPRAMEGPTSSSAIFYGALSVHLGPFLLLRTADLWSPYLLLRVLIGMIGVSTAIYSSMVGRTRSDVKTALGYGTITQIGIIYLELSLGLRSLALFHLCGHALMRTWQFLRSSSLIQDFQENPKVNYGYRVRNTVLDSLLPMTLRKKLFIFSLQGFFLDQIQLRFIAEGWLALFKRLNRLENQFGNWFDKKLEWIFYA